MSLVADRLERKKKQKVVYFVAWKTPMRNGKNQEGRYIFSRDAVPRDHIEVNDMSDYFLKQIKKQNDDLLDGVFISEISRIA